MRHTFNIVISLLLLVATPALAAPAATPFNVGQVWGQTERNPLPEEQAFRIEAIATDEGAMVRMRAAPGYYIYQDRSRFSQGQDNALQARWPQAETYDDPHFGLTPIHRGEFEVQVDIPGARQTLRVDFQGCQEDGICYPPMTRELDLGGEVTATSAQIAAKEASKAADTPLMSPSPAGSPQATLADDQAWAARIQGLPAPAWIGLFFLGGLVLSLTPCVLPLVPVVLGMVAPQAGRRGALALAGAYVLAHAGVLALAGVATALMGGGLGVAQAMQTPSLLVVSALAVLALGAWQAGWIQFGGSTWNTRLQGWMNKVPQGRLMGAIALGSGSALILGPCVAPATAGALLFVAQEGSAWLGGIALFAMGIGMGAPLLLMAAGLTRFIPRSGAWMTHLSRFAAAGLFAVAALLFDRASGGLATAWWILAWALSSLMLWGKELAPRLAPVALVGVVGVASALSWERAQEPAPVDRPGVAFTQASVEQVRARREQGGAFMLNLTADWCSSCLTMKKTTFVDPRIVEQTERLDVIELPLDEMDDAKRALLREYGLIGPPAILFFDAQGQEKRELRLIGEENAEAFSRRLERAKQG